MGQAAYTKKVAVSDDNGVTWHDVPCSSPSLELTGDVLDDTELATNAGFRTRVLGLNDWSVQCDSRFTANNDALTAIRDAKINRTALMVRYLPDGTVANGFKGDCVVENFNMSGAVEGLEEVAITLQANGALGAA